MHAVYTAVRAAADLAHAHALWSAERDDLFAHHPQSPIAVDRRAAFTGVPVKAYDPAWRFELPIDVDVEPLHIDVATGTDGMVPFDRVGRLVIPDVGGLDVWALRSYGGGLFIPLRDRTANHTTYGGGRYLIDTAKGAELGSDAAAGTIVLDFNFAYYQS